MLPARPGDREAIEGGGVGRGFLVLVLRECDACAGEGGAGREREQDRITEPVGLQDHLCFSPVVPVSGKPSGAASLRPGGRLKLRILNLRCCASGKGKDVPRSGCRCGALHAARIPGRCAAASVCWITRRETLAAGPGTGGAAWGGR